MKLQHPNAPENHASRCAYRRATGSPPWNLCDCGTYTQWLLVGAPAMEDCAEDAPPEEYLKTWHWECPDHGVAEMFMTTIPMCAKCNKKCVQSRKDR